MRQIVASLWLVALAACGQGQPYDVVIRGGRVIDPETNFDAVREIGIRGQRIEKISTSSLEGKRIIDATGLVVAPGFIDLHQHGQDDGSYKLKAEDGVTTALEMESGVPDYPRFLEVRKGKTLINYGATVSQEAARVAAWGGTLPASNLGPEAAIDDPPSGPASVRGMLFGKRTGPMNFCRHCSQQK